MCRCLVYLQAEKPVLLSVWKVSTLVIKLLLDAKQSQGILFDLRSSLDLKPTRIVRSVVCCSLQKEQEGNFVVSCV